MMHAYDCKCRLSFQSIHQHCNPSRTLWMSFLIPTEDSVHVIIEICCNSNGWSMRIHQQHVKRSHAINHVDWKYRFNAIFSEIVIYLFCCIGRIVTKFEEWRIIHTMNRPFVDSAITLVYNTNHKDIYDIRMLGPYYQWCSFLHCRDRWQVEESTISTIDSNRMPHIYNRMPLIYNRFECRWKEQRLERIAAMESPAPIYSSALESRNKRRVVQL